MSAKRQLWKDLEDIVTSVAVTEKLLKGDLNGHVGATNIGFERVHGGFGYGDRNKETS
jgi:hypothetical protein